MSTYTSPMNLSGSPLPVFGTLICSILSVRANERLDCAALVHRGVRLRDLRQRELEVEHDAGVDGPVEYELEQVRQVRAAVRRAALDPDVLPEELLDGQVAVRYADEADVAADSDSAGRLETGIFGADT